MADADLSIVMVQLCEESWKSHRVLNDGNADRYPVIVGFSRRVDEYQRKELATFGIIREDKDRMFALIEDTTLEQIRDRIAEYNEVLASAVERARQTREAALAEDERLTALAREMTLALRQRLGGCNRKSGCSAISDRWDCPGRRAGCRISGTAVESQAGQANPIKSRKRLVRKVIPAEAGLPAPENREPAQPAS
jgi:hypothetical protein